MTMLIGMEACIPAAYFSLLSAISMVALHLPQAKRIRSLPLLLIFGWLSFYNLDRIPSWYGLDSLWGLFTTIYLIHISSVLFIEQTALPCPYNHGNITYKSWNIQAARKVWNDPRSLSRTSSIPGSENSLRARNTAASGRGRIFKLCTYCLVAFLIDRCILPALRPFNISDFSSDKEIFVRRLLWSDEGVTVRETLLRLFFAVHWVVVAFVLLEVAHQLLAIFFVAILRTDRPEEWPPLFGSPLEIHSVESFWGKFWHRIVRPAYKCYARLLSRSVLKLEPNSRSEKVFISFSMFFFSGIVHSLVSWKMNQRCGVWLDVAWFVANFLVCALEHVLSRLFNRYTKRHGLSEPYHILTLCVMGRVMGPLWVWMFFAWSVPKWQYPRIHCAMMEHSLAEQQTSSQNLLQDLSRALGGVQD